MRHSETMNINAVGGLEFHNGRADCLVQVLSQAPLEYGSPGPVYANRLRPKADFGGSRGFDGLAVLGPPKL